MSTPHTQGYPEFHTGFKLNFAGPITDAQLANTYADMVNNPLPYPGAWVFVGADPDGKKNGFYWCDSAVGFFGATRTSYQLICQCEEEEKVEQPNPEPSPQPGGGARGPQGYGWVIYPNRLEPPVYVKDSPGTFVLLPKDNFGVWHFNQSLGDWERIGSLKPESVGTMHYINKAIPQNNFGTNGSLWTQDVSLTRERRFVKENGAWRKYYDNTGEPETETPGPTAPTITFTGLGDFTVGDPAFTLSATSTNKEVPITFASSNSQVISVSLVGSVWRATIVGQGTVTITAQQTASASFLAGSATQSSTVSLKELKKPNAPTFSLFDDTANTVVITPDTGVAMSLVQFQLPNSATWQSAPSDGKVTVGNVEGSVKTRSIASNEFKASDERSSQAFTITVTPTDPTPTDPTPTPTTTVTAYVGSFKDNKVSAATVQAATVQQWDKTARTLSIIANEMRPGFAEPQSQGIRKLTDGNGFNLSEGNDYTRTSITLTVNGQAVAYWLYVHLYEQENTLIYNLLAL